MVYFSKWERNCVKNTFARAGFERTRNGAADGGWNAFWGHHATHAELANMNKYQRVNVKTSIIGIVAIAEEGKTTTPKTHKR